MAAYRLYFRDGYSGSREANDHAFIINERETGRGRQPLIHGINVANQNPAALPEWLVGTPTLELPHPGGAPSRWEGSHAIAHLQKISGVADVSSMTAGSSSAADAVPADLRVEMPTVRVCVDDPPQSAEPVTAREIVTSVADKNGVQTKVGFDAVDIHVPFGGSAFRDVTPEERTTWSDQNVRDKDDFFGGDGIELRS